MPKALAPSAPGASSADAPSSESETIRSQLGKLLKSRHFSAAPRMQRFLSYVVEQTLHCDGGSLKEWVLGAAVFDKGESFDPRTDPIVRIEAGRLRERLKRYYRTEGRNDPVVIEIRKGAYIPCFRKRQSAAATPQRNQPGARSQAAEHRIAVLPFTDLSPEQDQEFFCDGIVEELIGCLVKIPGLRVVAWSSTRRYKGAARDIRRIGTQLDVDSVLEGSVRKMRARVRISVRLVRIADECCVRSETHEAPLKDLFSVQETVARAVVSGLSLELTEPQAKRLACRRTGDPEAYRLFLKGRYLANRRTEEGLAKGIQCFEQSIQSEPAYAPAWARLAECYVLLGWYGFAAARQVMPKARAAALKALEIGDDVAEAHTSLGLVRELYDWDWWGAEKEFWRASELNPGDASVLFECGFFLSRMTRLDEGLECMRRARQLDPLSPVVSTNVGVNLYYQREFDQALQCYLEALELDPNYYPAHFRLAMTYLHTERLQEGIASLERAKVLSGECPFILGLLGHALAVSGDREGARRLLSHLDSIASKRYVRPLSRVPICLGLGDEGATFEWLDQACREHDAQLVDIKIDPLYDQLRPNPRFQALLRRMNLQHLGSKIAHRRGSTWGPVKRH